MGWTPPPGIVGIDVPKWECQQPLDSAVLYPALLQADRLRAPMESADSRLIYDEGLLPESSYRFGESRSDLFAITRFRTLSNLGGE